ncbi:MAG: SMC-Scp complex subunit ScpB [Clostridia bacterium]|nr:SMC-Scp complex subunit ScpB [Clostridia bacterium]
MTEEIKLNKGEDLAENEIKEERVVIFEEAIEAILFAAGHPISYATLARIFEMTPAKVKDKVFEYSLKYNAPDIPRGVILLTYADSCQLCTKETYLTEIRDALGIKKSGTLSTSSMEVLAIIAYNQPVTRAFVDTLRRVDSSYAMNNLLDRGLIVQKGRLDVPGRPMLYGTTSDFLRCFGLSDLESLPKTSDELMAAFNGARSAEAEEAADGGDDGQIEADIDSVMPDSEKTGADAESADATPADTEELDLTSAEDDIIED